MSAPPNSPPPPDRVPFGAVRLAGPVAAAASPRRAGRPGGGRWYGPRVDIPLLTIEGLRTRDVTYEK